MVGQGTITDWDLPIPVAPPVIPEEVTLEQFQIVLVDDDLLGPLETAIAAIVDNKQKRKAEIALRIKPTVPRKGKLVSILKQDLGLTNNQVDDIFVRAAKEQ